MWAVPVVPASDSFGQRSRSSSLGVPSSHHWSRYAVNHLSPQSSRCWSTTTISGYSTFTCVSSWVWKCRRSLARSVSNTFVQVWPGGLGKKRSRLRFTCVIVWRFTLSTSILPLHSVHRGSGAADPGFYNIVNLLNVNLNLALVRAMRGRVLWWCSQMVLPTAFVLLSGCTGHVWPPNSII